MPMTDEQRVARIVWSFQSGALCESEFIAVLLDASRDIEPRRLMELLPEDLAEDVAFWMTDDRCIEGLDGPEFVRLNAYLRNRT